MEKFERAIKNPGNEAILTKWYEENGYTVSNMIRKTGAKNGTTLEEHYLLVSVG
jgi:hypothetical protein